MAETKTLEREYIIPLRKAWLKVPEYERTPRAIKAIKKFIAKHMKVPERDTKKVKLDVYFNNELWFRGIRKPPAKIKVRAVKEGDIVKVNFVEIPEHIKFLKAKIEKRHKIEDKKPEVKEEKKEEIKPEEKTETEKKEEKEKEQAVAEQHLKETKLDVKAQKHLTKKKETGFHRMALKK